MSARTSSRSATHADGYRWVQGTISNPGAWSLVDPTECKIAHVYRAADHTWTAVWDHGGIIATGQETSGYAMRAADDVARPCAHIDVHPSHGIVPCDNDRVPGATRCVAHLGPQVTALTAATAAALGIAEDGLDPVRALAERIVFAAPLGYQVGRLPLVWGDLPERMARAGLIAKEQHTDGRWYLHPIVRCERCQTVEDEVDEDTGLCRDCQEYNDIR